MKPTIIGSLALISLIPLVQLQGLGGLGLGLFALKAAAIKGAALGFALGSANNNNYGNSYHNNYGSSYGYNNRYQYRRRGPPPRHGQGWKGRHGRSVVPEESFEMNALLAEKAMLQAEFQA